MTEFKVGDRVKVEYTGTVKRGGIRRICVDSDDGEAYIPHVRHATIIEPRYEYGATYEDAKGERYIWVGQSYGRPMYPWMYISVDGRRLEHRAAGFPHRPLRKVLDPAKVQT